jgi:hypothetical protein
MANLNVYKSEGMFIDPCAIMVRKVGKEWLVTYNHGKKFNRQARILGKNQDECMTILHAYRKGYDNGKEDK